MMSNKFFGILLSVSLICPVTSVADAVKPQKVIADVGFKTPEAVEYSSVEDVYLVSNINGSPLEEDDNGFISKVSPDGKVIDLKWIDGKSSDVVLNAPKGLEVVGKLLFVADINQVHVFDAKTGEHKRSIPVEGSTFLNGVTAAGKHSVYVTDSGLGAGFKSSGADAVYKINKKGKVKKLIASTTLKRPNGIWNDGKQIWVASYGSNLLMTLNKKGIIKSSASAPAGSLDGLVKLVDGRFMVSSWESSSIYAMGGDGNFSVFAENLKAPADLGVDTKRKLLLVPLFKDDKVVTLPF